MGIRDEFAKLGAKQKNVQWSVSAFNDQDELVLSLWHDPHFFKFDKDRHIQTYTDDIHRWSGLGRDEMARNLQKAWETGANIRLVCSRLKNPNDIQHIKAGVDASRFPKIFSAKLDWIGKLVKWDQHQFIIEFRQEI